jgi:hypothetical protein
MVSDLMFAVGYNIDHYSAFNVPIICKGCAAEVLLSNSHNISMQTVVHFH